MIILCGTSEDDMRPTKVPMTIAVDFCHECGENIMQNLANGLIRVNIYAFPQADHRLTGERPGLVMCEHKPISRREA